MKTLLLATILILCSCQTVKPAAISRQKTTPISHITGTIVLDPGHGGEDGGAVSRGGLKEKDLTLDIALKIKRIIAMTLPNVKVILTRQHDVYVGLENRVAIANKNRADLFISIHINSNGDAKSSGFEIYSLDVASNRHSERLAQRENQSFTEKSHTKFILADLRAHSNRQKSDQLAKLVASGINNQVRKVLPSKSIKDRGYNQAIFHVLFVNMPSVLAEMFFISNPAEERLLKSSKFRELCARGIVVGVKNYLETHMTRSKDVRARR
jgi:N-acetylmuramoyl-L-alanine amidase